MGPETGGGAGRMIGRSIGQAGSSATAELPCREQPAGLGGTAPAWKMHSPTSKERKARQGEVDQKNMRPGGCACAQLCTMAWRALYVRVCCRLVTAV